LPFGFIRFFSVSRSKDEKISKYAAKKTSENETNSSPNSGIPEVLDFVFWSLDLVSNFDMRASKLLARRQYPLHFAEKVF
jgi:hypothetical protein